jgi:hypothetical protein
VDAVDAQRHLNTLGQFFALGSLVLVDFFFRRAKAISLALLDLLRGRLLRDRAGTISGSEDVERVGDRDRGRWPGRIAPGRVARVRDR